MSISVNELKFDYRMRFKINKLDYLQRSKEDIGTYFNDKYVYLNKLSLELYK